MGSRSGPVAGQDAGRRRGPPRQPAPAARAARGARAVRPAWRTWPAVNPSAAFAAVLADELVRCGMREAVLAPGSRSAPLALALHDRAAAGELRLHVRIDERSASFLALGLAKAGPRPVGAGLPRGAAGGALFAA